jgi:hypothetical protein
MSKLNVVRQIKFGKGNQDYDLQKELGWNNRFHLGKLPAYNAYNDTNCIEF